MKFITKITPFAVALLAVSCSFSPADNSVPVSSVSLNEHSIQLYEQGTFQLETTVNPSDASNKNVTWSSSNENYVQVSENGLVTAVAAGTARITVTTVDGKKTDSCTVTVNQYVNLTGVSLNPSTATIYDDETYQLNPSFQPSNASNKSVVYSSSDESVLTVSETGLVTPVAPGTANAIVTTVEGNFTASCAITINHKVLVEGVSLNETDISILDTETFQLVATVSPSNATIKTVTWRSEDTSVCTVSNNGLVTAVAAGQTSVVVTTTDGSYSARCDVDVREPETQSAIITFKTASEDSSSALSNLSTLINTGVDLLSSTSSSNAYAGKYGVKLSSNRSNGSFTLNFNENYVIAKVVVNACVYVGRNGPDNASLTISGVTQSIDSESLADYTFKLSGTDEVNSLTFNASKRLYINSLTVKYTNYEPVYPTAITINGQSDIDVYEEVLFTVSYEPKGTNQKGVTWSSLDPTIASVTSGGVVKGLAEGNTTIKAIAKDENGDDIIDTYDVSVHFVNVTSVTLNKGSVELTAGKTAQLSATILPANATDKSVSWSSSNNSVASVSNTGLVTVSETATAGQTATITATSSNSLTATCEVTVVEQTKDSWTILIYMCGSNLESDYANKDQIYYQGQYYDIDGIGLATSDIKEIISVEDQPDDVNIVIETGGAKEWTNKQYGQYGDYSIDASRIQRHHVENNKIVLDQSLTYSYMGTSSTLQSFIEYGLETYPAEKTALIMWNHGGGLQGVCFDEKHSQEDSIDISELTSAVSGALSKAGMVGEKLEWIGYDACLMQLQDIAIMNSPYFNYMVAAQESEAGEGWDYDNWVDNLYAGDDTETVLAEICDTFIEDNNIDEYGRDVSSQNDQTLSFLDLSQISAYETAWENMAAQLKTKINSSNQEDFVDLVKTAKVYASDAYGAYGMFDAKDFVNKLAKDSTFNPGSSYTKAVTDAHANLVKHSAKGKAAGNSNGLSMYFVVSDGYYLSSDYNYYRVGKETTLTNWVYICENYGDTDSGGGWGF